MSPDNDGNFSDMELLQGIRKKIEQIPNSNITLIGDIMLDRYVFGYANNLNPTAPVPVLKETHRVQSVGAAAHAARGAQSLGLTPILYGIIGDDEAGSEVELALNEEGVSSSNLIMLEGRKTTVKTRMIASRESLIRNKQLLLRWDEEDKTSVSPDVTNAIMSSCIESLTKSKALIISDYGKGVLNDSLVRGLLDKCKELNIPSICDPKLTGLHRTKGADAILFQSRGMDIMTKRLELPDGKSAANKLLDEYGWGSLFVIGGENGVTLYQPNKNPEHYPCTLSTPLQQIGLLDAAAAALAAGLTIDLTLSDCAILVNAACECILLAEDTASFALTRRALATRLDETAWKLQISQR